MLTKIAEGVLVHESDFMESRAVVVYSAGRLGIPLQECKQARYLGPPDGDDR